MLLVRNCHLLQHLYPNVRLAVNSTRVKRFMNGMKVQFSLLIKREEPMTVTNLITVWSHSQNTNNKQLFTEMLLIGFCGLHRQGRITVPKTRKII